MFKFGPVLTQDGLGLQVPPSLLGPLQCLAWLCGGHALPTYTPVLGKGSCFQGEGVSVGSEGAKERV